MKIVVSLLLLLLGAFSLSAQSVAISEFMASNSQTLADEDGEFPDWIELYNSGATSVNLNGWSLTDDAAELRKWVFPSVTIAPKGFLIVFASGKNRLGAVL